MSEHLRFDRRAFLAHVAIALIVGGMFSYFTNAKWIAASFWVSAALFINGSLAYVEDARPGGFDNPEGTETPEYVKGWGATKFALSSFAKFVGLIVAGLIAQKYL